MHCFLLLGFKKLYNSDLSKRIKSEWLEYLKHRVESSHCSMHGASCYFNLTIHLYITIIVFLLVLGTTATCFFQLAHNDHDNINAAVSIDETVATGCAF